MPDREPSALTRFQVDSLEVEIHETRAFAGRAAARAVASAIADRLAETNRVNVVFAAAPSQDEFLAGLGADPTLDWSRVVAFHMDEYLGLTADHPASFRRYLSERLFRLKTAQGLVARLIPGEKIDRPLFTCAEYESLLLQSPPDIICAGIGENGHLAFNDPPVADFLDPVLVKVVRLDPACRLQQVNDGCFEQLADVPTHAYTITMPVFLRAPLVSVVAPGPRKARAIQATLKGPVTEACPASALRGCPGARLYLDRDSAKLVS